MIKFGAILKESPHIGRGTVTLKNDPRILPFGKILRRAKINELPLDRYPGPVIIDEIQYAPSLLRYLKYRIDVDRSPGRYLLTGAQIFSLMQGVSESLTGRCGVLNLHTLSMAELLDADLLMGEKSYIFLGGYPELHGGAEADLWFPSYVATYLERDVRNILRVVDLKDFNRFIRACALRTSQVLNYSDLASDTGSLLIRRANG